MSQLFQYQPLLEDRMIRLLEFLPGDSPKVQIITTKLDDAPAFAALSYTWGENKFDHNLSINGSILPITQNLSEALDALFGIVRDEKIMFWVDLVCINQNDLLERGSQVSFMGEIYKSAQKVCVWLGKASSDSNLAMDKMIEWSEDILGNIDGECEEGYEEAVCKTASQRDRICGPPGTESHQAWMAIFSLWERPWWRRAWIVQETAFLPKHRIHIHCGDRVMNMTQLRHILNLRHQLRVFEGEFDYFVVSFEQVFAEMLDNIKTNLTTISRSVSYLLHRLRFYECGDPRDKVYAALGIASDLPSGLIQPDYTRDFADVYTDVVQQLSSRCDDQILDFLGYVVRPVDGLKYLALPDQAVPTWVPDWRGPKAFFVQFRKRLDMHNQTGSSRVYNASLDTRLNMRISGRKLHIDGLAVDTIISVLPICARRLISDTSVERKRPKQDLSSAYVAGGTVGEAYNHAITADVRFADILMYHSPFERGGCVDWDLIDTPAAELSSYERKKKAYMLEVLKNTSFNRRLYVTAQGYIGLGPAASQVGDKVCVFLGGQVLYVLRKKDSETHEFVGESYVHGLMDGKALTGEKERKVQEFVLV